MNSLPPAGKIVKKNTAPGTGLFPDIFKFPKVSRNLKIMLDISRISVIITHALNVAHKKICESAGTGRQARLRGVCQPTWEFKSPLSH